MLHASAVAIGIESVCQGQAVVAQVADYPLSN